MVRAKSGTSSDWRLINGSLPMRRGVNGISPIRFCVTVVLFKLSLFRMSSTSVILPCRFAGISSPLQLWRGQRIETLTPGESPR
ncbi:hypothetical protein LINPERPRIM_LOCUS33787 [Linum perenne]